MSHPFGDLISQHLARRHGLSQGKLAFGIDQDPAVIARMCKGERLSGKYARERVVRIIGWLHEHKALDRVDEANAFLVAAGMSPLNQEHQEEQTLLSQLGRQPESERPATQFDQQEAPQPEPQLPLSADAAPDNSSVTSAFPALPTLELHRTNLPVQPTPLIGREREIAVVGTLLRRSDVRLVTLTGPGGTGKTRLGVHVAAELLDEFADGVFFVNLAPINDPALVNSTIAQTLGVTEARGQPLEATLKRYLHAKQLLLLLDNFEHVLQAAPLVADLLAAAAHVKVIVTSRAVLHLRSEHEYLVPPLALPDPKQLPPVERLTQYHAVRLFIERAQAVKPDFLVTNANAPAVAEICVRLDGLPLAIELAAVRIKLLGPDALLHRLSHRLKLLTGGARDLPARQQTLWNTIEWSYSLLNDGEQALFRRLAVFVGGRTLEAIEAVCHADGDVPIDPFDGVASLLDKSLLRQADGTGGESRFIMLETIREYALEQLETSGEAEALRQRHATYFLALAEAAEPALLGPEQAMWLDRLEHEHANVQAVLAWARKVGETSLGVKLSAALVRFWQTRGYLTEGRWWLETLLNDAGSLPMEMRAKALNDVGWLAICQGDYTTATPVIEESLALWRKLENKNGIALALNSLGNIASSQGVLDRARICYEESLVLRRGVGDTYSIAVSLNNLGNLAGDQGDYMRAKAFHEESLALRRTLGDTYGIAVSLNNLGLIALNQANYAHAKTLFEESLLLFQTLGDNNSAAFGLGNLGFVALDQGDVERALPLFTQSLAAFCEAQDKEGIPYGLEGLAGSAAMQGKARRAAHLWGAAAALREATGAPFPDVDRVRYERFIVVSRSALGDAGWQAAWDEGRAMSLEQAIAYALDETES